MTWQDNSGSEDGYRILEDGTLVTTVDENVTAAVVGGLAGGAEHTFTVRAFRADHDSSASEPATVSTPLCDVSPPAASWAEPVDGATLRQPIARLEGIASDDGSGIERVELRARWDETWHDLATRTSPPYRADWDLCAAGVPDGPIDLRLRVFDNAGNDAAATITVAKRVNCAPNQPPAQPRIDAPTNGARRRSRADRSGRQRLLRHAARAAG